MPFRRFSSGIFRSWWPKISMNIFWMVDRSGDMGVIGVIGVTGSHHNGVSNPLAWAAPRTFASGVTRSNLYSLLFVP